MTKPDVVIFSVAPSPALNVPFDLLADSGIKWSTHVYSQKLYQRGMGAYQVANHCRVHGYSCQVVTFLAYFDQQELEYLAESFIGQHTVIGFSTVFLVDNLLTPMRRLVTYIQQRWPNNKTVLGGNLVFSTGLDNDKKFDAYFTGYGEQSFVEWLDQHHKKSHSRIYPKHHGCTVIDGETSAQKFDIQTLDHQWHEDDCLIPGEQLPIEIARGCIFACKFCSFRNIGKKKFDYIRNSELIKKELIYNYEKFGITSYVFSDDTFNDSTFKVQTLHDIFVSLPFQIEFFCYLRLDLLRRYPEQIGLLKNMGLRDAWFGIETLNWASGQAIGKGLHPKKIKQMIHDLVHVHWQDSVSVTCSLIVGLPYETVQSQLETFAWFDQYPTVNTVVNPLFFVPGHDSSIGRDHGAHGYVLDEKINSPVNQNGFRRPGWINNVGMTEEQACQMARDYLKPTVGPNGTDRYRLEYLTGGDGSLKNTTWAEAWPKIEDGAKKFREQYRHKLFAVAERYRQQ